MLLKMVFWPLPPSNGASLVLRQDGVEAVAELVLGPSVIKLHEDCIWSISDRRI